MKDLLKLVAEPAHGLFFHTLHTINSGTLVNDGERDGIIDKYKKIKEYEDKFEKPTAGGSKFILFAICIIDKKILLMKTFHKNKFDSIDNFFSINHDKVCEAEIHETNKGWTQIRLK